MCLYLQKCQKSANQDVEVVKCEVCEQSYWHKSSIFKLNIVLKKTKTKQPGTKVELTKQTEYLDCLTLHCTLMSSCSLQVIMALVCFAV